MTLSAVPILLGLASALTWGGADFAGGLAARYAPVGRVILFAHGISLAVLCLLLALTPGGLAAAASLSPATLLLGLASGISGGLGLMLFYKALSIGAMGLSAALAGLLTAALPVAFAIAEQGRPGAPQLAGFAVAAVAITLIAWSHNKPGAPPQRRTLAMAAVAGIGFGVQLVILHIASAKAGVLPALALSRLGGTATGATAMLWAGRRAGRGSDAEPVRSRDPGLGVFLALAAATGLLDTAGNGLYMAAALAGRLDVAAVLASLYPGATILLAAWLLKERTSLVQAVGMGLALIAVGLISA